MPSIHAYSDASISAFSSSGLSKISLKAEPVISDEANFDKIHCL